MEGHPTTGLLDTGSQVSCISESFLKAHLAHLEVKPLDYILKVRGVNGSLLPYLGYVEADVKFQETVLSNTCLSALFLVTEDTSFSYKCPVLVGTNIISSCLDMQEDIEKDQ